MPSPPQSDKASLVKIAIGVTVAGLILFAAWLVGDKLSLAYLASQEAAFRQWQAESPWLVYGGAFVIYVVVTGLSLPGAAALTIVYGWLFDWWQAVLLVSFASTAGATIAFLLSRYLFRNAVQNRFASQLAKFNDSLKQQGAFYLFTLRLIVGVPFFVINLVMGLTPVRVWTFWWVSQLGMLPGTLLYTYVGHAVPSLETLSDEGLRAVFSTGQLAQIFIAFALLGLFPWAAKWVVARLRSKVATSD